MNAQDITPYTPGQLAAAGGQLWEKGGKRRLYFNDLDELFGLDCSYYGTGNVYGAKLDGERISNTRAREILGALGAAKVWYDLADAQFHWKMYGSKNYAADDYGDCIVAAIKERISAAQEVS